MKKMERRLRPKVGELAGMLQLYVGLVVLIIKTIVMIDISECRFSSISGRNSYVTGR